MTRSFPFHLDDLELARRLVLVQRPLHWQLAGRLIAALEQSQHGLGLKPDDAVECGRVAGMRITREAAWRHLCEWTQTDALRKHARAVEVVMRAAALRYGAGEADVEAWGIAGMLHDADYEKWPEEHPRRIVAWLRERGEESIAHAISAHFTQWNVPYETALDRALLACDELTGFVGACALVREGGLGTLGVESVLKKLKDKHFAAKVDRDEVRAGAELLRVELGAHVAFVVEALRPHAEELGLAGAARAGG